MGKTSGLSLMVQGGNAAIPYLTNEADSASSDIGLDNLGDATQGLVRVLHSSDVNELWARPAGVWSWLCHLPEVSRL